MKTLFFVFVFILLSSFLHATIINVPGDQPTIQAGINSATNSDTVLVQLGTYLENINYNGNNITVASLFITTQDTTYISQTIIDGNQNGSVVTFESGEDSNAVLCGLTITNGLASGSFPTDSGGGIYCNQSSPSLKYLTISGNSANLSGGGIVCWYSSSPSLENLTILGNSSADSGGGIYCGSDSSPNVENVTISGNTTTYNGGGFFCYDYSSPLLQNMRIVDNTAMYGGGIYVGSNSSINIVNVTIKDNSATYHGGGIYCGCDSSPHIEDVVIVGNNSGFHGGGISCCESSMSISNATITANNVTDQNGEGGGVYCYDSSLTIVNTIVSDNTGDYGIFRDTGGSPIVTYTDCYNNQNGNFNNFDPGFGCIFTDPLFVDPANGNFHLTSNSPCIDTGDPDPQYNDPDGTRADMGAYFFPQFIPPVADFTADTTNGYVPLTVNFTDLSTQGTGVITDWKWYFDDGDSSSVQNPIHTFYESGDYTISLNVTDENDSTDTEIKTDYITVLDIESNFEADTTFGYYPSVEVNFTDLSLGNITNWSWDFQNDNEYDSFEQNPTFTYTDAGIYSVKLKISDGVNVDSLVMNNYITVVYVPPAPPTEVEINISGNDAVITWTTVDTTIFGTMITPDGYIVLNNEDPYTDFIFLSFTPDTTYTHAYVGQYIDRMFYRVVAVINLSREEIKYLLSLNNSRDKVKWSDVKRNFNVIRK